MLNFVFQSFYLLTPSCSSPLEQSGALSLFKLLVAALEEGGLKQGGVAGNFI
jgi:hypothetical protein